MHAEEAFITTGIRDPLMQRLDGASQALMANASWALYQRHKHEQRPLHMSFKIVPSSPDTLSLVPELFIDESAASACSGPSLRNLLRADVADDIFPSKNKRHIVRTLAFDGYTEAL